MKLAPGSPLWSHLRRHKLLFAAVLASRGLWELIPLQVPVLAGIIVDGLTGKGVSLFGLDGHGLAPLEVLQLASLGLLALALAYGASAYASTMFAARLERALVTSLRRAVFEKVMELSLDHHQRRGAGELLNTALQDTARIRRFTEQALVRTVTNVVRGGYPVIMLFVIDPVLALIAVSIVPPQWLATRYLQKRLHVGTQRIRDTEAELTTDAKQDLDGVETIQALHAEKAVVARFNEMSDQLEERQLSADRITAHMRGAIWFLTSLGLALTWWQGGMRVLEGGMTLGTLIVFMGFTDYVYRPFRRFTEIVKTYRVGLVSLERIGEILAISSSVPVERDARPIRIREGRITFRDVSFGYGTQTVLRDVNLTIEPRQFTALAGRAGAGKSSLLRLIPRLYDPTHGRVLIDGQALETATLESLRSQVALVPQQPILFTGTILENVQLARPDATLQEIEAACAATGSLAFIEHLEDGFDTRVGRGGRSLSGGQLQRLAIARALLTRPRILLLDEPTSALDAESEALIVETLRRLRGEMTVVVAGHRTRTICAADKIVLLDAGQVTAEGTHDDLLRRCEPYADLFATGSHSPPPVSPTGRGAGAAGAAGAPAA
jgi:ABC-type multidrug transport system fused ATPase/permease subunit